MTINELENEYVNGEKHNNLIHINGYSLNVLIS